MKKLERKVFLTIFVILTFFLIVSLVLINVVSYRREYESIRQNLNMIDERGNWARPGMLPFEGFGGMFEGPSDMFEGEEKPENRGEENMMFGENEVYIVDLENEFILQMFDHGDNSSFDPKAVAEEIVSSNSSDAENICNLYTGSYSYRYVYGKTIVIINTESISAKIRKLLIESLILFVIAGLVIAAISKLVTGWITRPAKEAFDKQKEFIADASHELKTPLAVIMASSDELTGDAANARYIDNIKYESDRMNKLITGLLDLSKLEEGVSRESFKEENLTKIVEKTCLVFEGVAFEDGVGIDTEIESDISLNCSKEEMEKLVSTLVDNAVKHSEKNTSVLVKLYRSKGAIVLKVVNTGEPIAPGDEEKIFERFYRADKSRNRSENRYGLGLAIAKSIVLNHNGTIKAYSEEGKTVFRVEL